ncbi:ABC transporter G family member 1-like [Tasmannia lanceolata]|uniref:ABC transporter G family member 1-like n=1 Tax=Tasmannia lanceolata TaxID=3420 RepID=UPI0040634DF9
MTTLTFFALNGFPCPSLRNPSDHYLRTINKDFDQDIEQGHGAMSTSQVIDILINSYKSLVTCQRVPRRVADICKMARGSMLMFVAAFLTFMAIGGFPSFVEDMKLNDDCCKHRSGFPHGYYHRRRNSGGDDVERRLFPTPDDLPKPLWRYPMYYIAFHKYANRGLYKNEFIGLTFPNNQAGGPSTINGDEILRNIWQVEIGYSKWVDLATLFGMVVLYRLMFLSIIKINEKVKPMLMIRAFLAAPSKQASQVI